MRRIVGLGNPGPKYRLTRHNVGFMVVDRLAQRHRASEIPSQLSYSLSECEVGGTRVHLVKPMTFMNCSGHGLMDYLTDWPAEPGDLLVVTDDVYLPLGKIRIRRSGGDGGHNGMASIIEFLGTESFPRLRFGVGLPERRGELATYVLKEFPPEEIPVVEKGLHAACEAVETLVLEGIDSAMNKFNG